MVIVILYKLSSSYHNVLTIDIIAQLCHTCSNRLHVVEQPAVVVNANNKKINVLQALYNSIHKCDWVCKNQPSERQYEYVAVGCTGKV